MGWRGRGHGRGSGQNKKILVLADSKTAIAAGKKAGRTGKARSRHLQRTVNMMAEVQAGGREVKTGWVKAHMGILRNEAADVLAKQATEGVPPHDHDKWGITQWAMGWRRKAVTNYCRLPGGKGMGRWWEKKVGRIAEDVYPQCGEEEQTPDHIVFRCGKVRRVKDERGRRVWARENGMRWDS